MPGFHCLKSLLFRIHSCVLSRCANNFIALFFPHFRDLIISSIASTLTAEHPTLDYMDGKKSKEINQQFSFLRKTEFNTFRVKSGDDVLPPACQPLLEVTTNHNRQCVDLCGVFFRRIKEPLYLFSVLQLLAWRKKLYLPNCIFNCNECLLIFLSQ